jgi:hypothetical protein
MYSLDSKGAGNPASNSPSTDDAAGALSREIAALADLDLHGLRVRWRELFRKTAPPHVPKYLLLRIIAYRIQANALGDLDRETIRFLHRIAREHATGNKAAVRLSPPKPRSSQAPCS